MKKIALIIIFISYNFSLLIGQCTVDRFCLSFGNPQVVMDGSHFEFDLIVSSNSDFGLGTSNLQFQYNNQALTNPQILTTSISAPTYQTPSITTPFIPSLGVMVGSFNVELNSQGTGMNIPVAGTIVSRLRFEIIDASMNSDLSWYYSGGTAQTVVFDHDESTQLCAVEPGNSCLQPSSSILPLDLVEFKTKASSTSILLEWLTENELNASHFDIERSIDGTNFKFLDKKSALYDLNGGRYAYEDFDVSLGIMYYYRLKIVDLDGLFKYSEIRKNILKDRAINVEVFPNPVSKDEILHIKISDPLQYNFILVDAKGKLVLRRAGADTMEISLEALNAGVYFYQIEYNNKIESGKLIVN